EVASPQAHGHVGHAHGGAGVAGVGLLNGVHGQCADRIGHLWGLLGVGHGGGLGWWFGETRYFTGAAFGHLNGPARRRRPTAMHYSAAPCKACTSPPISMAAVVPLRGCWTP